MSVNFDKREIRVIMKIVKHWGIAKVLNAKAKGIDGPCEFDYLAAELEKAGVFTKQEQYDFFQKLELVP